MKCKKTILPILIFLLFFAISFVSASAVVDDVGGDDFNLNNMDFNGLNGFDESQLSLSEDIGLENDDDFIKGNSIKEDIYEETNSSNKYPLVNSENNGNNNLRSGDLLKADDENVIYISPSGTGNGQTIDNPTNWTKALSLARNGYTISFHDGVYTNLSRSINKNLNLIALNVGNAIIDGCGSQIFMTTNCNLSFTGLTFINGNASYGGALQSLSGNLDIINCTFRNNSASSSGGAIYAGYNLNIVNSSFENNSANNGGGIYSLAKANNMSIVNSSFENNSARSSGGAIYSTGGNLTVTDSEFINNSGITGGAILAPTGNTYLNNSTFKNNNAGSGGAIYLSNDGNLTVSGSEFINNSASHGSALYTFTGNPSINNSKFINNSASNDATIKCTNLTVTDSEFINNSARGSGSAIMASRNAYINNSKFINNSAEEGSGAVDSQSGNLTVIDSEFIGNSARSAGAINSYGNLNILNSSFENNSAESSGGAISSTGNLTVIDSEFIGNRATMGGAISSEDAIINKSTFINNSADYSGGALHSWNNVDINNSTFDSNDALNGGALYVYENLTVNNSNFINNEAYDGSAIISRNLDLDNGIFENNTSRGYGIIYAYNATIKNSNFTDNEAVEDKQVFVLSEINQESNSLGDDQIKGPVGNLIDMSDYENFIWLCLQSSLPGGDDAYLLDDLSLARNQLTGEDISEYLKILVHKYFFSDISNELPRIVWEFSDNDFRSSDDEIVREILSLYDSGFRVPDKNASLILENGTQVLFDFFTAGSSVGQNWFLFNHTFMGNIYEMEISKISLNESVLVGQQVQFIIRVKNTGDTILHGITVLEDKYDGLVYDSFIDNEDKWTYDNSKWTYKYQLNINETAEFIVIFNTTKPGNFTNIIVVSSEETDNMTTNNTTSVEPVQPDDPDNPDNPDDPDNPDEPVKPDKPTKVGEPKVLKKLAIKKVGNPILVLIICLVSLVLMPRRNRK